jgi:dinuclear metal center YbgI/SA1388 family protein
LVHHGLFWNPSVWTGATYRKLRAALEGDLAVYSAHLPLDVHPEFGNNVLLAGRLGLTDLEPVLDFKGMPVGLVGRADVSRDVLADALTTATGARPHVCAGGPERVRRVAVVTGGAGSEVARVAAAGVDTFVTGEGPHWSYTLAEELGVNLFYGGHYATETFGVKALAERLGERFGLPWEFLDHPTGL